MTHGQYLHRPLFVEAIPDADNMLLVHSASRNLTCRTRTSDRVSAATKSGSLIPPAHSFAEALRC